MVATALGLLLFPAMMALAASSDLLTMTISNRVSATLIVGFFVLALIVGMSGSAMLWHVGAGCTVLVVAFTCFAMGWIAVVHRGQGVSRRISWWLAGLVAALVVVALARLIPGRPGYWLDLALLMFASYLFGCAAGSWLRAWALSRDAPA